MSWWPRVPAALLVVVGVLVACGDDDGGAPAPSTTSTSTTEAPATTTTVDPFTVPDDPADITVEYVEAVLTELERINGDALRLAMEEGVTPEVTRLLQSTYVESLAEGIANRLLEDSSSGFQGFRENPGDVVVEVHEVLQASDACIFVDVDQDYGEVAVDVGESTRVRIELIRVDASLANATGWLLSRFQPEGEQLIGAAPCA